MSMNRSEGWECQNDGCDELFRNLILVLVHRFEPDNPTILRFEVG